MHHTRSNPRAVCGTKLVNFRNSNTGRSVAIVPVDEMVDEMIVATGASGILPATNVVVAVCYQWVVASGEHLCGGESWCEGLFYFNQSKY